MKKKSIISKKKGAACAALVAFLFVLASSTFGLLPSEVDLKNTQNPSHQETSATLEQASVVRVVDGDTLVIDQGRGEEKLRLIGIDCPESVNPDKSKNTEGGRLASDFTKSVVSAGQPVLLQKDTSDTDRYGRLLRYVWLVEPKDAKSAEEVTTKMLNAILVVNGHAIAKEYRPDTAYSLIFDELALSLTTSQLTQGVVSTNPISTIII